MPLVLCGQVYKTFVNKKIFSLFKKANTRLYLPFEKKFSAAIRAMTPTERKVFRFFVAVFIISAAAMLWRVNSAFLVEVPARGGTITEGVIGTPRFINPLFAVSDADRDLTTLIYSGLMRPGKNGVLEPDLAQSYEVSEDGLNYTFTLKDGLVWHDGKPITADDVIFTVQKAQDPALRSTKLASWDGVGVEKVDDKTIRFTLKQPYSPFLENTTLGILPKHIWKNKSPEEFIFSTYNTNPVGSGPYKVKSIKTDKETGIPQYYELEPFDAFALGKPYIKKIVLRFYPTPADLMKALEKGDIDAVNSISPKEAAMLKKEGYRVESVPFPKVFGAFFNQNRAKIFTDKAVRKALNAAIDKQYIIDKVLYGYATPAYSPIPPGALGHEEEKEEDAFESMKDRINYARDILTAAGWKFDEEKEVLTKKDVGDLVFSITTTDTIPELEEIADILKQQWEAIGAKVEVKVFELGDLNENVIRPRKYDILLFGEIVGRSSDMFVFWHSSQRLDPGLNVALYANITADKLLEDARKITDPKKRSEKYRAFADEVRSDIPAVFLYYPDFIYVLPKKVKGVDLSSAAIPSERFLTIAHWYINTHTIWKIFAQHNIPKNTDTN